MDVHVIAVDLTGGDNAPKAPAEACVNASRAGIHVVALGTSEAIEVLSELGGSSIETILCEEVISPDEHPVKAIREKRNSSIVKGMELLKEGKVHAFVSGGSTGALVAGGVLLLGRAAGIERPCLATVVPSIDGHGVLFLDLGASPDVKPTTLVQFGVMGYTYAQYVLGWDNPSVGLLNIGVEADKGNLTVKKAYELMQNAPVNFKGNVEARDVFSHVVDVVVTDGFTGNVFLKTCEGTASFQGSVIKREIMSGSLSRFGGLLVKGAFQRVKDVLDYTSYGGAPLLGLAGCVIKCHGSSNARAIFNGIREAQKYLDNDVASIIAQKAVVS